MIELCNVERIFEKSKPSIIALKNINLKINKGEKVIIIGDSGAGKSTLLKIIGLADLNYKGIYNFNGENIKVLKNDKLSRYRNKVIVSTYQDFLLIEDETVFENLEIPLLYADVKNHKDLVKNISDFFEIEHLLYRKVDELSRGEKQRVAIVRSLINNPEIIILDEPTSSLNNEISKKFINKIYEYVNKNNKTLIVSTHNLERVARGEYRLIRIDNGEITQDFNII